MIEKIKVDYIFYQSLDSQELTIKIKNGKLYYDYYLSYEKNNIPLLPFFKSGMIEDYSNFEREVEKLDVYSFEDKYEPIGYFVSDGFSFVTEYKEVGKPEKRS